MYVIHKYNRNHKAKTDYPDRRNKLNIIFLFFRWKLQNLIGLTLVACVASCNCISFSLCALFVCTATHVVCAALSIKKLKRKEIYVMKKPYFRNA